MKNSNKESNWWWLIIIPCVLYIATADKPKNEDVCSGKGYSNSEYTECRENVAYDSVGYGGPYDHN